MNLAIKNRLDIAPEIWDQAVEGSPHGWYFGLSRWIEGILSVQEWGLVDYSFGVLLDNRVVALIPLQLNKQNQLCSTGWGWSGPIFLKDNQKLKQYVFDTIDGIAFQLKAHAVRLGTTGVAYVRASDEQTRWLNPWLQTGYVDTSSHTQIILLSQETSESLWGNLSQTARQLVRKFRDQLRVERVSWLEHLDSYYKMHCQTYAKSQLNPHPYEYFKMIANFPEANHRLFGAFDQNGKVVAYHNDLSFKESSWYHTATSTEEGNRLGAHYLLTWFSINYAHEMGDRFYEIGQVSYDNLDKKINQISFFKTRFGGKLYRVFRAEKEYNFFPTRKMAKRFLQASKSLTISLFSREKDFEV